MYTRVNIVGLMYMFRYYNVSVLYRSHCDSAEGASSHYGASERRSQVLTSFIISPFLLFPCVVVSKIWLTLYAGQQVTVLTCPHRWATPCSHQSVEFERTSPTCMGIQIFCVHFIVYSSFSTNSHALLDSYWH